MDAGLNTFSQLWQSPLVMRYGEVQPISSAASGASQGISGALSTNTHVAAGSLTQAWDATEGLTLAYATTATGGLNGGVISPASGIGVARRAFGARVRSRAKASATVTIRRYFGFTSNNTLPISDTPLGAGDSGVLLGYRSTDTVWNIFNNDATGAEVVTATTGVTTTDTNYHTLEINWAAGGNVNCIIDGNVQTAISTRIPPTGTNLFFNEVVQTTTTTANTLTLHAIAFEATK